MRLLPLKPIFILHTYTEDTSIYKPVMFLVTTNTQYILLHRSVNIFASGLQMRAIIEGFTDFNTHCCPDIRLCGWQKACTLVINMHLTQTESIKFKNALGHGFGYGGHRFVISSTVSYSSKRRSLSVGEPQLHTSGRCLYLRFNLSQIVHSTRLYLKSV